MKSIQMDQNQINFSVQIAAKENNIPGIIVEHAFVTNTGDVNTYLNNEAGLKKAWCCGCYWYS